MLVLSLSTGNKIGLAVVGLAFIVFALVSSMLIPRSRPDFPAPRQKLFIVICVAFFVAMMAAVIILAKESEEAEATGEPATTQTRPAETTGTETTPTTTQAVLPPPPTGQSETTPTGTSAPPVSAPDPAQVAKGEELYTSLGCIGCHSLDGAAGTGPTFKGLYGSGGGAVDDEYLMKSIQDPDADIAEGFQPGIMSAVIKKGAVSDEDAEALVAFIESQK